MTQNDSLSCICVTYGRTARLSEAIACFKSQDYAGEKELLILNTCPAQQFILGNGFEDVRIINLDVRPPSLGAARNIAVAFTQHDYIVILDDDDLALPNHLSTIASHFEGNDWVFLGSQFFCDNFQVKSIVQAGLNCVAFRKSAWEKVGGYADNLTFGEDQQFVGKLTSQCKGVKVQLAPEEVTFLYCWNNGLIHVSGFGRDKDGQVSGYTRMRDDLEGKFSSGEEKRGEIRLEPKLIHDPRVMVSEFLGTRRVDSRKDGVCIVMLGRFGDVINILPVAKHIHDCYAKPYMMIGREFASVLDGVSYVEPYPVDLDNAALNEGVALAKKTFKHVIVAQIWGKNWNQEKLCRSFNEESWRMCGFQSRFEDSTWLPLFDKRDEGRESALVNKASITGKPLLLVQLKKSVSSPFSSGKALFDLIVSTYGDKCDIVDLSDIRAHRIYDVLGLMDKAAALVSLDTAHLHLAPATGIPVVALVNNLPWLGSIVRGNNCVERIPYDDAAKDSRIVLKAVGYALTAPRSMTTSRRDTPPEAPIRNLIHAVERHESRGASEQKRKEAAQKSWDVLYTEHGVTPAHYWNYERTAMSIGDVRSLPYLKDVLKAAMNQAADNDIIFWTNDDIWLHPDIAELLKFHVSVYGACVSRRLDFDNLPSPNISPEDISNAGVPHIGRDLFAATKGWLEEHWENIADSILGAPLFDFQLASLCRLEHGYNKQTQKSLFIHNIHPAEIPLGYVCHQKHTPYWTTQKGSPPSHRHNEKAFKDWAEEHLEEIDFP